MEAGERQTEKDEQEHTMFVDTSRLETDIHILGSEIMTPSPLATPLHEASKTNFYAPAGKAIVEEDDATTSSVRTPAGNLLDKFQCLNESWVDVKARSASAKKRVTATPTMEYLLKSPIPKFASALNNCSSIFHTDDENDDLSSIGASTVSSMSSQESVFDRLFKHGTNQQRRRRNQKPSDSFISPRGHISTNDFYTPYSSSTSSVSSNMSRSKNSTSKQQTKKIRNRVVPTSSANNSAAKIKSKRESRVSSSNSSIAKNKSIHESPISPTPSQDSVFDRLYRNKKRTESLWQAPPAPRLISRSTDRKRSGQKSSSRRASKTPAQSTPQTVSKPKQKKKRISASPAGPTKDQTSGDNAGKSSISHVLEAASAASDSVDNAVSAPSTLEESTRDDSADVRSSAAHTFDEASIASEKENKSRPGMVATPREQPNALKTANWSTTSIDEDLAELAAIQRDLEQQQQYLAPTPRKTNVPMEKVFEEASWIEPKQLYASSEDQEDTDAHQELDDFDDILKAPQVSRSRAPSVASTVTHTQVDDDDTTSRASSGFFTLDFAGSSLTLQPIVSLSSRGSIQSKQTSASKTVKSERIRTEQAAVTIQSWWKSCLAQTSLANMVIEQRNLTFPSALDTKPTVLLRIINSTRAHSLQMEQHDDVILVQSTQISMELRLAASSVSLLRRRLSNNMILRAVLASARLEFEGVVFVKACQVIQRWWRRTRNTDGKHSCEPLSALKAIGDAKEKELSSCLEGVSDKSLDEVLLELETLSKDSAGEERTDRASLEPQKTLICNDLSLLDDVGESDEELLVSPAKSLVSQNIEVDCGRELFPTPPSNVDSAGEERTDRASLEPQKTLICNDLSLLDDVGESDEELLVSPAKSLVSQNIEVDRGREVFPTPPSNVDIASIKGYVEQNDKRDDDPVLDETPARPLIDADCDLSIDESPVKTLIEEDYDPVPVGTPLRTLIEKGDQGDERQEAASIIQRSFRMSTLASAIQQSTPTRNHVRQALSSPKFPRWQEDDPWLLKEPSDGFQLWTGSTDLIERNAVRLATHNIVRAYLNGLRKYRRIKKATLIQSTFRGYQRKKEYQEMLWASLAIQHGWKRFKYRRMLGIKATVIKAAYKMKMVKNKFHLMRFAAVLIQNKWRSYQATRVYSKAQFLASWLQRTCVRGRGHRRRYLALRSATISLQYSLRVYRTKKQYNLEVFKAIKIQSAWRMYFAKRKLLLSIHCVCKIQALIRCHFTSTDYVRLRSRSIAVQSCWRKHKAMKTYEIQRIGAVKTQAEWRGFLAVRWYKQQYESVVRLQSLSRMQQCLRLKRKILQAAVVIQRDTRRFLTERSYIVIWKAVLMIQTQQRKHSAQISWFKTQKCVVCIQSVVRGHICQLSFKQLRDASVKIQSLGRSYNQRCQFLREKNDITAVQSVVRRKLAENYWKESRVAVIFCQKMIRSHLSSAAFARAKTACVSIQKVYRRFHAIQDWENVRSSIIRIQSLLRMIHSRRSSNHALFSVRILQSAVRGYRQRSKFTMQRRATVKIQSIARSTSEQTKYAEKRKASIAIQSIARRLAARYRLSEAKSAAIIIQKTVRKMLHLSHYLRIQLSVTKIQTIFRGFSERSIYHKTRSNLLKIQKNWRGAIARFQASSHYRAVLLIQRYWRGKVCRDLSKQRKNRIILMQRLLRGHITRRKHEGLLHSRLLLAQSSWRAAVWRRRFMIRKSAALKLQATVRGYFARKKAASKLNSAVLVQALVRCYQQHQVFQKLLVRRYDACTRLQAYRKMHNCKKSYDSKRQAVILMQSCFRKTVAVARLQRALKSVRLIQSQWRMALCREEYSRTRVLTVMIQALVRGSLVRTTVAKFHSMAIWIQRHWRGHLGRLHYIELVEKRNSEIAAARLTIQSTWRMHVTRVEFRKVRSATTVLQKEWRAFSARENFEFSRIACIVIQTISRGALVRMEMKTWQKCALDIQKRWRGYLGARRFQILLEQDRLAKVEKLERMRRAELMGLAIRAYLGLACISIVTQQDFARQQNDLVQRSCTRIQSQARGMLVRQKLRDRLSHSTTATKIQTVYRNWVTEKCHDVRLQSVIMIQNYWRSRMAYQQLHMRHFSCVIIQRTVRGSMTRVAFKSWHKSAICIQKIWRGFARARKLKMLRESKKAATKVQSKWRMHKTSRRYKKLSSGAIGIQKRYRVSLARSRYDLARRACTIIQSNLRGALVRQEVKTWNDSAICVQKMWHQYNAAKKSKSLSEDFARQSLAALKIQSIRRMEVARGTYRSGLRSVTVIQKHWRSSQAREYYEVCRASCVIIQSVARGFLVRDENKIFNQSVVMIQKYWRSAVARERYELFRGSCIIIQSIIRESLVRKKFSAWNVSAMCVQKNWRRCKGLRKVQSLLENVSRMQSPPRTPEAGKACQSMLRESITNQTIEIEDRNQPHPDLPSISAIDVVHDLLHQSATPIQKVWRGASLRGSLAKYRMHSTFAATLIQASFRGYRGREMYQAALMVQSVSATLIQSNVRGMFARNILESQADAASAIQRFWRNRSVRLALLQLAMDERLAKEFEKSRMYSNFAATTLIQASFRRHRARELYQTALMVQSVSATLIQSNVRGMFARNILEGRANAASAIQRFWRNRSVRLALLQLAMDERLTKELEISYRIQGATVLQSMTRRRIAQKSFCAIRNNIIVIQSVTRGYLLRMQMSANVRAATTIQKHMRGASSRSHIRGLHNIAIIIQAFIRMVLVSRQFWFLRLPQERRELLNNAARKIQVAFFLFKMRLAVLSMQSSAIILKRCIRGQLVRSAAKFALVHVNSSFHNPVILSFARVVAGNSPNYAPTYVAWRRAISQAEISSTIVIQSAVRRFLVRARISRDFNVNFDSGMLLDQTLIEEKHTSALIIQQTFQRWRRRKECRLLLGNRSQKRIQAAIQLQRVARGRKDRILARAWKVRRERSLLLKREKAAIQLQKDRILARASRIREAEVSRNVTALVLDAIQRSSKARVEQLVESHSSAASLFPSLKHLVNRTQAARTEAVALAANPLPMYSVKVLEKLEKESRPETNKNVRIKPTKLEICASPRALLEPKRSSTPVRCNKSQPVKDAMKRNALTDTKVAKMKSLPYANAQQDGRGKLVKAKPQTMKKAPKAKHSVKQTQLAKENVALVKSTEVRKPEPKQAKNKSKIGMGALDLIKFGRETIKKAPNAKISLKSTALRKTNATITQVPQSPPKKETNTLFGDPSNMPSPIKKQADWDWADEW